jgi:hypothetical protein
MDLEKDIAEAIRVQTELTTIITKEILMNPEAAMTGVIAVMGDIIKQFNEVDNKLGKDTLQEFNIVLNKRLEGSGIGVIIVKEE